MSLRPILIHPDPRLKKVCGPIARITPEIEALADDMLATMYDAPGIGLAAPQVGVLKRLFVVDASRQPDEAPRAIVMVNPELDWSSEAVNSYEEGCLSIPEYYEEVERPDRVRFRYTTLGGETIEQDAEGLMATCVQHEIDHLNGVLFIDYLSRLKRDMVVRKVVKSRPERTGARIL